jgi:hypothetical protein
MQQPSQIALMTGRKRGGREEEERRKDLPG